MSYENNMRAFAMAADSCSVACDILVLPDGIQVNMSVGGKVLTRRVLHHDLALARAPWGAQYIDDMKQKILALARTS